MVDLNVLMVAEAFLTVRMLVNVSCSVLVETCFQTCFQNEYLKFFLGKVTCPLDWSPNFNFHLSKLNLY